MAQDVVDRLTDRPCRTARLPLIGAAPPAALRPWRRPERLVRRYGTEAPAVAALADGRPELLEPRRDRRARVRRRAAVGGAARVRADGFGPRRSPGAGRARAGVARPRWWRRSSGSGSAPRRHEPRACREAGSRLVSTWGRYSTRIHLSLPSSRHGPGNPPRRYTSLPYPAAVRRSLASTSWPTASCRPPARCSPALDQRRRRPHAPHPPRRLRRHRHRRRPAERRRARRPART